jgi:extracellular factor (EF) 3-hydroxypalmitic acid methyl ester biosynthesis protein
MTLSSPKRSTTVLPPPPVAVRPSSVPSRRESSSPPPSGRHPISSAPPRHEDLPGASGSAVRFRPARVNAADLPADLACRFLCEGLLVGPLSVVDLSTAGFAAVTSDALALAPGSVLEAFELLVGEYVVWTGDAVVVHGNVERIGARFTSGVLDLEHLRLGATMDGRLAVQREQREHLPAEWRAAVADVRQLLEDARLEMEAVDRAEMHDPMRRAEAEATLFAALRAQWGAAYFEAVSRLHAMSVGFDKRAAALGRNYASSMLGPLLMACPLQRRAYEKPLGYAGDYRMMELCFTRELAGDGLFGRFLHSVAQHYTLVRAVVAREVVMRQAVIDAANAEGEGPVRVLALAAGPAIELRRMLAETGPLRRGVEMILLDQDQGAHESAHRHLTRVLQQRHRDALPVTVHCLHFSVSQLIRPQTDDERRVVQETLADLDLAYSAGLYDYLPDPVAARLTQRLYGRLRGGGRLLLGNLVETPDSTWVMEYVLGWTLRYRTDTSMLHLADGCGPAPTHTGIVRDATGQCLFLDVRKPVD